MNDDDVQLRIEAPDLPQPPDLDDGSGWADPAGFDPVPFADPVVDDTPEATDAQIRLLLEFAGADLLGAAIADDDVDGHWEFTADELDAIVPPLTRIVNRRPALRRLVAHGDGVFVVAGLARYARRNLSDGAKARRTREEDHGIVYRQDRDVSAGDPTPGQRVDSTSPGQPWGAGVGADEAAGLGAFQG